MVGVLSELEGPVFEEPLRIWAGELFIGIVLAGDDIWFDDDSLRGLIREALAKRGNLLPEEVMRHAVTPFVSKLAREKGANVGLIMQSLEAALIARMAERSNMDAQQAMQYASFVMADVIEVLEGVSR